MAQIDLETITESEAEDELDRLYDENPEVVGAILASLEISDPLAGPVRQLREVMGVA